jgi:hypothetical protein
MGRVENGGQPARSRAMHHGGTCGRRFLETRFEIVTTLSYPRLRVRLSSGRRFMTDITQLHRELVNRALDGDAQASRELRLAAFDNAGLEEPMATLIEKVAHRSYQVTDQDVAAVRTVGLNEDQIFETVVCAAIGAADRQNKSALAALAEATGRRR